MDSVSQDLGITGVGTESNSIPILPCGPALSILFILSLTRHRRRLFLGLENRADYVVFSLR